MSEGGLRVALTRSNEERQPWLSATRKPSFPRQRIRRAATDLRLFGTVTRASGLTVLVAVTAVSGTTPTLDLKVQWSFDGVAFSDAETPDSFTQIIGVKSVVKQFTAKGPFYRLVYTVGGTTPSFTFSASTYVTD